ncbi:MAG TPA: CZB domain-containing protein [Terriglobales bacterium]|nr:CZB domain-containing protein [Terriglobales bacterium]
MTVLDFSLARSQHLTWKTKVRDFLEGRATLTANQATSHKDCDLGKWLYGTGMQKFGSTPGMKDLEKVHANMHASVKQILSLQGSGKKEAAQEEYKKFDGLSDKVISLLKAVEKHVMVAH